MLNQLVESKENHNGLKNGLLLITLVFVFVAFFVGLTYSLFAQQFGVGGDGLELSTLVAPPIPEEAPPPPEPEPDQPKKQNNDDSPKIATRKELIARLDMSPKVPDKTSVEKFTKRTIPKSGMVQKGASDSDPPPGARPGPARDNSGPGFDPEPARPDPTPEATKRPPPPPPPAKPPVPKRISKGVVNGQAISLPKPAYPAAARAVNAKGAVSVAIVISKSGSVMSASAVSGHPLLRRAAQSAARRAKFRPTLLSGQPVEVSGVIVYNFQ